MKPIFILSILMICVGACKKAHYEWEDYQYTGVPIVTIDTTKSALATRQAGKVVFFNKKDADLATQQFSFTLEWAGFNKVTVTSIEVYNSYNKAESSVPAYPLVISSPGNQYTNIAQFPLPSIVGTNDHLYETVTEFPKTFNFTAAELAALNNVDLSAVAVNDYFLFKFIVNLSDGRRVVTFYNNICDESRGEPGDCRVGVRFKNQ
ncbi:MAG: hypothetical protein H6Q26_2673 [Bacteroidetes bacterium]|uniref:hypothetical protein n=1 Tax=unclassified Chitinophaga TaxID=2619133 RepID=UPI0009C814EE|nr:MULTISPECIES: hypothetical protein [unclassified Chitinophaga]MBP1652516.1 hypothetical protein [Bacteroidota bacterium]OMP81256.1 hypothetical protein BW716_01375 [[Flexibacter] sp. ATCC 35208]WPV67456.1 hypothetical protein QQL36_01780 [Chitinophaga sp. LS1]